MKLWKLFTLIIALVLCVSATALAYDGEILDITADSDDDPFTWDPATDEMAKYIQDNFGINFIQSETNYYNNDFTVTQLAANEGKLPEVFTADILYYTQEITQFIPEELVAEIPQELIDKYPLTKERLENDAVSQLVYNMYGGYYFLPKPDSADPSIYKAERKGLFIRKDWLAKLGLDMPQTWEELYEVCHAFTYNDPDGNGVNDTYGLTGDGLTQEITQGVISSHPPVFPTVTGTKMPTATGSSALSTTAISKSSSGCAKCMKTVPSTPTLLPPAGRKASRSSLPTPSVSACAMLTLTGSTLS